MPWLDEALAEYSVKIYYERLHGPRDAALLERQRWQTPYELLAAQDEDVPINRAVGSFEDGLQYETVVYGKGALFYSRMREVLGDRRFQRFMREYLAEHRYQIVDTQAWHDALDKLQMPELELLFEDWIGDIKPIVPTPVPDGSEEGGDGSEENGDVEEEVPDTL